MLIFTLVIKLCDYQQKHECHGSTQQCFKDDQIKETGNQQLATYFISDEEKEYIVHLKNSGKEVEAVKKLREVTSMDLVQAKNYIDAL